MTRYYSQNGEDVVLDYLFRDQPSGVFVEVGCIDGKRFSNTLALEEKGWRGLCVEAHADYIPLLRRNRPGSIVCHCAAAEIDDENGVLYANRRGSLSTLNGGKEREFRRRFGTNFHGFEIQSVVKRRLDGLFREHSIHSIDVLSVDIEGEEANALRGIDFQLFQPRVLVIECDDSKHEDAVDAIVFPANFLKLCRIADNVFYTIEPRIVDLVRNRTFRGEVTHTAHPLDAVADEVRQIVVSV